MDITMQSILPIEALDKMARASLGSGTSGVSVGGGRSVIHLLDESAGNQTIANAIFSEWDGLTVNASTINMNEGDPDPSITVSAGVGTTETVGYVVLLDGVEYATGTESAVSGTVTLNLVSPVAGVYQIYVYRTTGNYSSGSVTITVNEV